MKKIVSAALVASLVAGAAFAEVSVSSNVRVRPVFVQNDSGTECEDLTTWMSLDNNQMKAGQAASDSISIKGKTDYAGATVDFNISGTEKASVTMSNYNAYLKFGNLTFTGGLGDSRIANAVTKDQNNLSLIGQNWGGKAAIATPDKTLTKFTASYATFAGNKKLGVNPNMFSLYNALEKGLTGTDPKLAPLGVDSDNLMAVEGTKALSFVADYMYAIDDASKVQFWAAANKQDSEWTTENDDGDTTDVVNSGYSFRAAYSCADFVADANLKLTKRTLVASAFFNPNMIDNLLAVVGFTFAQDSNASAGSDADTFWAVDARARYAINDALNGGIYLNYSNADFGDDTDAAGVLDTVLNVNYKVNDIITAFCEAEYCMNTNSDLKDLIGDQLAAQVGALFVAGKGAEIDVAVRYAAVGIGADDAAVGGYDIYGSSLSIPCCMRIKM